MRKAGDVNPGPPSSCGSSSSSSDGGGSHGSHGHGNRSLDGIVLHILADISQSLGLTIAGALLWSVPAFRCCASLQYQLPVPAI